MLQYGEIPRDTRVFMLQQEGKEGVVLNYMCVCGRDVSNGQSGCVVIRSLLMLLFMCTVMQTKCIKYSFRTKRLSLARTTVTLRRRSVPSCCQYVYKSPFLCNSVCLCFLLQLSAFCCCSIER